MADWSAAEAYTRSFARLCAGAVPAMLDLLGPARGALLDVGTGAGALALAAIPRGWAVRSIEPEPAMRRLAEESGLDVVDAALPDLPFPDGGFNAVAANFVVNHLADPRAGVAELRRVAAPNGAVAVSIWGSAPGALSTLWGQVLDLAGVEPLAGLRLPPNMDFARTEEGLAGLLMASGLADVQHRAIDFVVHLDPDDLWSAVEGGIGVIGATWHVQDDAGRRRLRTAYRATAELDAEGLLRIPAQALIAAGRRPR